MRESINEPVSVVWYYDSKTHRMQPYMLRWKSQDYKLGKIDFWHKTWSGRHQIHHFSISDKSGSVYFKLAFDTNSLQWTIEEYMTDDGINPVYRKVEK